MSRRRSEEMMAGAGTRWLPLLVIVAGVIAYGNCFDGVFVLDDDAQIVRNENIRHLWPIWDVLGHRRRPVVNVSLAINYALGELTVEGYHAFNLVVHILAGLTLFGVVRRTLLSNCGLPIADCGLSTGRPSRIPQSSIPNRQSAISSPQSSIVNRQSSIANPQSASWLALAVSLIWVVHPLQTQSVTYIIQRSESMMGLFYLLTLYCTIRGAGSGRRYLWYVAAVAACAMGMGSKPVMVTAPVVVLLYDRVFLSGSLGRAVRRRWGLYAALAATWSVLIATGVVRGVFFPPAETKAYVGFGFAEITPLTYALTQSEVLVHYLRLCLWPHPLCLDYAWVVPRSLAAVLPYVLIIAALVTGTVWALWSANGKWLGFLGAWFFIILAPTSSFIPIKDVAFEQRMYLSLAAVVVLLVLGARASLRIVLRRFSPVSHASPASSGSAVRWIGALLVITVTGALTWRTLRRNEDYHSKYAIWQLVLKVAPHNPRAHNAVGFALQSQGRLTEAARYYSQALKHKPDYPIAQYNMGNALLAQGKVDQAIAHYRQALRLKPVFAKGHYNLANALFARDELDEAITHYRRALEVKPDFADAHHNLGAALRKQGKFDEAIKHYRQALRANPDAVDAHYNLGNALFAQGKPEEAVRHYRRALQAKPNDAEVHCELGIALGSLGELAEAVGHYREAVRIKPDYAEAYYQMGMALKKAGQWNEALGHLQQAARLKPDAGGPLEGMAWILATHWDSDIRDPQEAVRLAERAHGLLKSPSATMLDTLAAAYAATQQFERAVALAYRAQRLAPAAGDATLADRIQERLQLYKQGRPYREPPRGPQ